MTLASVLVAQGLPSGVCAFTTLRGQELVRGAHREDAASLGADPARAFELRDLPAEPCWLNQVHGRAIHDADGPADAEPPLADGSITRRRGRVLVVRTADCLPVVIADAHATELSVIHAGWRGLAAGILEAAVAAFHAPADALQAWLGPAIGAASYEVGDDVYRAFVGCDPGAALAFARTSNGRWLCDLCALARRRLAGCGTERVSGGGLDTFADPERFHSFRRDRGAGRMETFAWLIP